MVCKKKLTDRCVWCGQQDPVPLACTFLLAHSLQIVLPIPSLQCSLSRTGWQTAVSSAVWSHCSFFEFYHTLQFDSPYLNKCGQQDVAVSRKREPLGKIPQAECDRRRQADAYSSRGSRCGRQDPVPLAFTFSLAFLDI